MRLCSIASGSSGNCIYIGDDQTHLLVDTGISKKRIEEGLAKLEIKGDELEGILITHEHVDHIQGLGVFSRKYEIPIYATPGTIAGIRNYKKLGNLPDGLLQHQLLARMGHLPPGEHGAGVRGVSQLCPEVRPLLLQKPLPQRGPRAGQDLPICLHRPHCVGERTFGGV